MEFPNSIDRVSEYYKRHGFKATISRAALAVKRGLFSGRMLVFYCDLAEQNLHAVAIPSSMRIDRLTNEAQLSARDLEEMTSFWNPKQARRNIKERFAKEASLWLIKFQDKLAGFSWTLKGRSIEPYYFPLACNDVQLFDFYVFPRFRGRAILWLLIVHILYELRAEGAARVFGDVAEWNAASLSFYKLIPFRPLGLTRSFTFFGYRFTRWIEGGTVEWVQEARVDRHQAPAMGRPHVP